VTVSVYCVLRAVRSADTKAFKRGMDAHNNPKFYRQLGKEPEQRLKMPLGCWRGGLARVECQPNIDGACRPFSWLDVSIRLAGDRHGALIAVRIVYSEG
jgi:hypothetical protein